MSHFSNRLVALCAVRVTTRTSFSDNSDALLLYTVLKTGSASVIGLYCCNFNVNIRLIEWLSRPPVDSDYRQTIAAY